MTDPTSPTSSRSAEKTVAVIPVGVAKTPLVMATSISRAVRAAIRFGSHILCNSTVIFGASAPNTPSRYGASVGATGGVMPRRTVPDSPAATWRTADCAAFSSSRIDLARGSNSAPAGVMTTRRVVRTNSGVPSSISRRRISSLSVGAAIRIRSAARPKCSSAARAQMPRAGAAPSLHCDCSGFPKSAFVSCPFFPSRLRGTLRSHAI